MKQSIVLQMYNEYEKIESTVWESKNVLNGLDYEIMVVDDTSTNGVVELVERLTQWYRLEVIKRGGRLGLGSAIRGRC